jgi:hypothetical protein
MRKTIIFGTLAALFSFGALAQASDRSPAKAGEGTQVTRVAANDSESRHERDKKAERSRERHDGSGDKWHAVREDHGEDEAAAHQDRR